jgi:hypothetical protein
MLFHRSPETDSLRNPGDVANNRNEKDMGISAGKLGLDSDSDSDTVNPGELTFEEGASHVIFKKKANLY